VGRSRWARELAIAPSISASAYMRYAGSSQGDDLSAPPGRTERRCPLPP
jgi:hypothetical protein